MGWMMNWRMRFEELQQETEGPLSPEPGARQNYQTLSCSGQR